MIVVSNDFKNAMKAPVKTIGAFAQVVDGARYTSADYITKLEVDASGYYFGVATKSLSMTLLGTAYDLVDQYVDITLQVLVDSTNGTWDNCVLGRFKITEQTVNLENEMTTIKGYDAIGIMGNKSYAENRLTFPTTVNMLAVQLASASNIDYEETNPINGTYTIQEDLYEKMANVSLRDILAEVAGASASLAAVHGVNSLLTFRTPPTEPVETLTYDNLKKVKYEPQYGVVNSLVLARTPQEDNVVVSDEESIELNGLTEVKLANNEILDDDRENMIQPIFDAVNGFWFYPFEATTEGHGWYEIGDRLAITDGTNTWEVIVTDIKLTIDGGLKETIKGVAPTETQTNYALAGGITKSIYNTEIKVDKQGQEITSVVSRQDQFEDETLENFSQVVQNINSITTTIQTTGGGNLVHNSVGYNKDTNHLLVGWTTVGTATSETSPESVSYGAISGNQIDLSTSSSITQRVAVDTSGSVYTLSFKAKKSYLGNATVHLRNSIDDYEVVIPSSETPLWEDYEIAAALPHDSYFDVVVETDAAVEEFAITDLILTIGDSKTPWVSASDEILSTHVAVDSDGVKVSSSTSNDYVKLDELGLNGYSDVTGTLQNVFTINRDLTEVSKLRARNQMEMPPLKIVPITSGSKQGWGWVKL